jgi:outer membrane protein assembly factor BamB
MFGEDTLWWDLGTSPVLTDSLVIVACVQSGPSYVAAFDKRDGQLVWKQDRMFPAPEESSQSYSTPVPATENGKQTLIVAGADNVTSHALDDGRELWRFGGLNPNGERFFRSIASPVVTSDLVLVPYARGTTMTAIRLGGQGDVTESRLAWFRDDMATDVPTAAVREDRAYLCSDRGAVQCLDVASGETVWQMELPRSRTTFSASPMLAGDYLYLVNEDGTTYVVDVAQEGKLVATNELNEPTVATPVLVDNQIYLQTSEHLYCLGKTTGKR